jgi:O-methyltransferase involved in polyketide biosynthesis
MSDDPVSRIDTTVPHSARVWNYWLGGKDNYAADRAAADEFSGTYPDIVEIARSVRRFLARVVRHVVTDAGIDQFLDVGTGLPTADNTHQVAQRLNPASRIVYVDNDPMVLAHARALLTSRPEGATDYIDADVHDPEAILAAAAHTLDFSRPVALCMLGVLGHVATDGEARSIVRGLVARLPSGSYVALSDGTDVSEARVKAHARYNSSGAVPYNLRSPAGITALFDGLRLLEPGVVPVARWRPDDQAPPPSDESTYGGLALKA